MEVVEYSIDDRLYVFSSCRKGGVSSGNYAEFNINTYCGDKEEDIVENRKLLVSFLNKKLDEARAINEDNIILPHQVHGTKVLQIDQDFIKLPQESRKEQLEGIDALMTNVSGVLIGVSTADCIPVIIYDTRHNAVAVVHAGWRGTKERIVEKTIRQMSLSYSTEAKDIHAVIGPGISVDAFEVGDEVYEAFADAKFEMKDISQRYPYPNNKCHIDLWKCNKNSMIAAGVDAENIEISGICTYNNADKFFSARRLGVKSGRILTAAILK